MNDRPEIPWPSGMLDAHIRWDAEGPLGHLHFYGPDGRRARIAVTAGASYDRPDDNPVWHVDIADVVTVSPSVHYIGQWHSPNPVKFRLVDDITAPE